MTGAPFRCAAARSSRRSSPSTPLLVGVTALVAAVVARDRLADATTDDGLLVLGLTVSSAILLNSLLLRARLEPMSGSCGR